MGAVHEVSLLASLTRPGLQGIGKDASGVTFATLFLMARYFKKKETCLFTPSPRWAMEGDLIWPRVLHSRA